MTADKFIRLNIALKPPKDVTEKAIILSCEISKHNKTIFILDNVNSYPHITVYSVEYPELDINRVLGSIKDIVKSLEKIILTFKNTESKRGYVSIDFKLSSELKSLHKKIVKKLNPLRKEHIMEKYKKLDYQLTYSKEQKENIQKYGYPNLMNLYNPHLTIIRLENEITAKRLAENLEWSINQLTIDKIAVYKSGKNGTCIKLLKEFNLK